MVSLFRPVSLAGQPKCLDYEFDSFSGGLITGTSSFFPVVWFHIAMTGYNRPFSAHTRSPNLTYGGHADELDTLR